MGTDVAAAEAFRPMNGIDRGIDPLPRLNQARSGSIHDENAAAVRDNLAGVDPGAGVED